ncbi:PLP-dependent transferase [Fistulina hepatica ATCC 64428]|uniref:PLP-dependent transferase n=1 Tax=Fistulina hepatica ATCC 64428 TaxID=1128425 RepID=A0A0D7AKZ4_9AGAR|nr:PLP-dependent transferase [Fistulina hepatica ATCC 64428]
MVSYYAIQTPPSDKCIPRSSLKLHPMRSLLAHIVTESPADSPNLLSGNARPVLWLYYAAASPTLASQASTGWIPINNSAEYRLTWTLDMLRRTDYSRLASSGETYVDYMGGAIYPESLVKMHTEFLSRHVLGNTHSVSNSSRLSNDCASEARDAVLSFFKAPPTYTVVFTANATAALKLVGESFPFSEGSIYVLGMDSHNSVNGIRQFATRKGASRILTSQRPINVDQCPSLFALTGQSNITNSKTSLSILEHAALLGYHTLLDASALAATSTISLQEYPVDAMAFSFYKICGWPTGVGALVVKKSFLSELQRPWFSGGNVDVVQVPGTVVTRTERLHERFEDGTINYLSLPAVTEGLRFVSAYLPFLPLRLSCLIHYLISELSQLHHDNGAPLIRILSRRPIRRLKSVGEQSDTGSIISLIFLDPNGDMIPNSFVVYAASRRRISLRCGCMCNPGGAAAILGIQESMAQLYPSVKLIDFERAVGRELGVVRISLGLASDFQDAWNVVQFAASLASQPVREPATIFTKRVTVQNFIGTVKSLI